jgi:DNA-binding winged helix-turn-helix (wHTH) protein
MTEHKCFVFKFADIEVREREFRVTKAGEVLAVEPKAFRVLLFLLHNPQKLVTKDELLDAVWNDAAVSENSAARAIAQLRRLLGDDIREPRYIATVATVGYRLLCAVEVSEDPPRNVESPDQSGSLNDSPHGLRKNAVIFGGAITAVVALAAMAAMAAWLWWPRSTSPVVDEVLQLSDDGQPKSGRLDTDGSRIYFNEGAPGVNKLAQVSVTGGRTAVIDTRLENPLIQRLSADGSELLVSVGHLYDQAEPLWTIPLPAGEPRPLGSFQVQIADLFPDGSILYATGEEATGKSLFIADRDGSNPRKLVSLSGYASNVEVSPDGKRILLREGRCACGGGHATDRLLEIAADGSGLQEIYRPSQNECCFHWSPDGKHLVYLTEVEGKQDIWALRLPTGPFHRSIERTRLTFGPLNYTAAFPSRDGKRIFAVAVKRRGELVRFDKKSHQFLPFLSGISAINVSFSRDGKWVAYNSYPDFDLWRSRSDGTERMQLTYSPMAAVFPVISPDGTRVAFHTANGEVFVVSMAGGVPQKIVDPGGDALWSPDGKFLLYYFPTPDGSLHVADVLTRKTSAIPSSQGIIGGWWVTQDKLIATDQNTTKFVTFDFKTQKWTDLIAGSFVNWRVSPDYKYLYFTTGGADSEARRLRFADLQIEKITSLKDFRRAVEDFSGSTDIDVAPDGSPVFTRDVGTQEIYSLSVHWP